MNLNQKEKQVIQWKAEGVTGEEIARRLGKSQTATKWLLKSIYQKCGCSNGPSLIRWAYENGVLKINDQKLGVSLNKTG
jgi:DNA-binding CsgD family transcriptional regulator